MVLQGALDFKHEKGLGSMIALPLFCLSDCGPL